MPDMSLAKQKQQAMTAPVANAAHGLAERLKFMIVNGRNLEQREIYALAQYAATNDLNPFAAECYYLPGAGPVPGIAGWRKKAQEQLNFEAIEQHENGAHFWTESRPATTEEAKFSQEAGDVAIFVTLRDWLSNKRWRTAYFDTVRQMKELDFPGDVFEEAKNICGAEPVWTGVGVVFGKEKFGEIEKYDRTERAMKRAEKIALRKRFPRVNLPDPSSGADGDAIDIQFTTETPPDPEHHTEAENLKALGFEPDPSPESSSGSAPADVTEVAPAPSVIPETQKQEKNGPYGMALSTATTAKNTAGVLYKDIDTGTLSNMINAMLRTPGLEEPLKFKLDAARTILWSRTNTK